MIVKTDVTNCEIKENKKKRSLLGLIKVFKLTFILFSILFAPFAAGRAVADGTGLQEIKSIIRPKSSLVNDHNSVGNVSNPIKNTENKVGSESLKKYVDRASLISELKYSVQLNTYLVAEIPNNSYLPLSQVVSDEAQTLFDLETEKKLIEIKSLYLTKAEKFKTRLSKSEKYVSHVGITIDTGEELNLINSRLGNTKIILSENVNFEISRVFYSQGRILFTIANTYVGNGVANGDLYIQLEIDAAKEKLEKAFKTSVLVSDVQFWWDKTTNIIAGEQYSSQNYSVVQGEVDVVNVVGLKMGESEAPSSRGFVQGGAIIENQPVTGVWAGGVCFWATAWNTAFRMGLETYGIEFKVKSQYRHSRADARYAANTVFPYVLNDMNYYDVTVFYSPIYGSIGSVTDMEEGKKLEIKTKVLISNPNTGRFLAITEAREVK